MQKEIHYYHDLPFGKDVDLSEAKFQHLKEIVLKALFFFVKDITALICDYLNYRTVCDQFGFIRKLPFRVSWLIDYCKWILHGEVLTFSGFLTLVTTQFPDLTLFEVRLSPNRTLRIWGSDHIHSFDFAWVKDSLIMGICDHVSPSRRVFLIGRDKDNRHLILQNEATRFSTLTELIHFALRDINKNPSSSY